MSDIKTITQAPPGHIKCYFNYATFIYFELNVDTEEKFV